MASSDIADLNVKIQYDSVEKATDSMKRLEQQGGKTEKSVTTMTQKADSSFKGLASQIKALTGVNAQMVASLERNTSSHAKLKSAIDAETQARAAHIKALQTEIAALNATIGKMHATTGAINQVNTAEKGLATTTTALAAGFRGLLAGIATGLAGLGVGKILQIGDEFAMLQAKIKATLGDSKEFPQVFNEITAISNSTGIAVSNVAQAFVRLRPATQDLGTSNEKLLKFTETFLKMGIVAGNTATEVNNAMIQLSQGLASGTLRGDELRSVKEQLPSVARAIAKSMKIPFEEFSKAAEQGKITAVQVLNAVLGESKKVDAQFAKMPITVDRAFGVITNGLTRLIGGLLQQSGIQKAVTTGMLQFGIAVNKAADGIAPFAKGLNIGIRLSVEFAKIVGGILVASFKMATMAVLILFNAFTSVFGIIGKVIDILGKIIPPLGAVISGAKGVAAAVWTAITSFDNWISAGESLMVGLARVGAQSQITANNIATAFAQASKFYDKSAQADIGLKNAFANVDIANQFDAQRAKIKGIFAEVRSLAKNGVKASPLGAFAGDGKNITGTGSGSGKKGRKGAADKSGQRLSDLLADINAETEANKRLYSAIQKNEIEYEKTKNLIEAENRVRQANLKISESQRQTIIKKIVANKEMEKSIQDVMAVQEQQRQTEYAKMKFSAFAEDGLIGLQNAEKQIEVLEKLRQAKIDALSPRGIQFGQSIMERQNTETALEIQQVIRGQEKELELAKSFTEARRKGVESYDKERMQLEAIARVEEARIDPNSIIGTQMRDRLVAIKEEEIALERIGQREAQLREIRNGQRLLDARKQGAMWDSDRQGLEFKAYEDMIRLIERENQVISEGLTLGSDRANERMRELELIQGQAQQLDILIARQERVRDMAKEVGDMFTQSFEDAIFGAESFRESLRKLAMQLAKLLFRETIGKGIAKLVGTIAGSFIPGGGAAGAAFGGTLAGFAANGAVLSNGRMITAFARGGVVDQPTLFPMSNGSGVMGEAGPEAIMPLQRLSNGKLGVASSGGSTNLMTINTPININVEAGAGGSDKDRKDLAVKIKNELQTEVKAMMLQTLREQQRPGNMLNKGISLVQ